MEKIGRANAGTIANDIKQALSLVAQRHGIDIDTGVIRYNDQSFKLSISGNVVHQAEPAVQIPGQQINKAGMLPGGLYPKGTMFRRKRTIYEIEAVHPNRPKNVYSIKSHNGAGWVCDRDFLEASDVTIMRVGPAA